jgi:GR25 family glycosyltransferase involved in LPS biosynthesis
MRIHFIFDQQLNDIQSKFWKEYLYGIDTNEYLINDSNNNQTTNDADIIIKLTTNTYPIKSFNSLKSYLNEIKKNKFLKDPLNKKIDNYCIIKYKNISENNDVYNNVNDTDNPFFCNMKGYNYKFETNRPKGEKIYIDVSDEELDLWYKSNYFFIRRIDDKCKYKNKLFINYLSSVTSSTKGINRIDSIYIINLAHRKDRLESITHELKKIGTNTDSIKRVNAIFYKDFGAIGCGMSHLIALKNIENSKKENSIILEDDFILRVDPDVFNNYIDRLFEEKKTWDVVMLGANLEQVCNTEYTFLYRIFKARTTSGYIINKKIVTKVYDNFKEACKLMKDNLNKMPEHLIKHNYAIDMYWQSLQATNDWYCFNPRLGKQLPSYSDVENTYTQYDA